MYIQPMQVSGLPKLQSSEQRSQNIQCQIWPDSLPPEEIVNQLVSVPKPMEVYFWYEGQKCLPKVGADFMKDKFFKPLYDQKPDAKLLLYSLRAWDFSNKNVSPSTKIGEKINCINKKFIECIYSSSFFEYCIDNSKHKKIYDLIQEGLPKKKWLFEISEHYEKIHRTVTDFFNQEFSLFNCIKDLDLVKAYASMQYVEAYYLIRKSVENGLKNGQKRIEIAFVLPNDEGKYYKDLPNEIQEMLQADFEKELEGVEINIVFRFFTYGVSEKARPYTNNQSGTVKPGTVSSYFNYLPPQEQTSLQGSSKLQKQSKESVVPRYILRSVTPRDIIHNLNGIRI